MKRNMQLVREIAFVIESANHNVHTWNLSIDGYSKDEVTYHCFLMLDAGLLQTLQVVNVNGQPSEMIITRLSNKGHDFVDTARNDTVWNQVSETLRKKGASVTIDMLLGLLKQQLALYIA